ncbi:MAG: DUF4136 domain-containing protein [Bacteroidetes bacterium HGW-Bacteroidetes-2]|jgi:hypothetical protein|nr:MAG: DUF4136 domain-containing protein [Bacteroidetes bacterium HGW-Bacteroidetes-2]
MKTLLFSVFALVLFASCSSVRVASDYDTNANFSTYTSYAFFKPGIDKAEISDLDKKRILRAIDAEMSTKGFQKSENPSMLISIFTKANERVDVYQNYYGWGSPWGWGWGYPWAMGYGGSNVSTTTEGTLYIDIIDAKTNELIWQGMGTASLVRNMEKKEARIKEIVSKILEKYPPG